jgi:hypothetical protein
MANWEASVVSINGLEKSGYCNIGSLLKMFLQYSKAPQNSVVCKIFSPFFRHFVNGVSVQLPPTKYDGCFRTQEFEPMTRQLRVREFFLFTRRGFAQCGP